MDRDYLRQQFKRSTSTSLPKSTGWSMQRATSLPKHLASLPKQMTKNNSKINDMTDKELDDFLLNDQEEMPKHLAPTTSDGCISKPYTPLL